jgi:hypothetical protein
MRNYWFHLSNFSVCSAACQNDGLCVATDTCVCADGFSGATCGTADPGKPVFVHFKFMSAEQFIPFLLS